MLSKLQLPRDLKTPSHALLCLIHRIKNKTLPAVFLAAGDTSENLTLHSPTTSPNRIYIRCSQTSQIVDYSTI